MCGPRGGFRSRILPLGQIPGRGTDEAERFGVRGLNNRGPWIVARGSWIVVMLAGICPRAQDGTEIRPGTSEYGRGRDACAGRRIA